MSYVIGIHMGHDASIAVLKDGKPVFCLSEERLTRQKMYYGFPSLSANYAINHLQLDPAEVDLLALDTLELPRLLGPEEMARRFQPDKVRNLTRNIINSKKVWGYFFGSSTVKNQLEKEKEARSILYKELLKYGFRKERIKTYDHHLSHAAAAFWPSPFEKALFATSDGRGDGSSALIGTAQGSKINVTHRISDMDSVGSFYAAVTFHLGFKPNRHEGKITGLAAHGDPVRFGPLFLSNVHWKSDGSYEFQIPDRFRLTSVDELDSYLKRMPLSLKDRIVLHTESDLNTLVFSANWYSLLAYLQEVCSGASREDVAAGVQYFAEEVCSQFIARHINSTSLPVVLAGGVFSNVRINQKIRETKGVSNVFIQPAMGDDGLSLGAALLGYAEIDPQAETALNMPKRPTQIENVYLGPDYSNEIVQACNSVNESPYQMPDVEKKIAQWIHDGKIVAYYRGRMEFGPRALGHRSILARATDKKINDDLNERLHRTEFMPFAPSILAEYAHEYLKDYQPDHVASEYMTITYNVVEQYRDVVPAITHVDGTARPQVVHSNNEPNYHRIISEYYKLSGIPLIINTSYNVHEEPIVCTPQDAIRTYKTNAVDILVMDDYVLGANESE